MIAKVTKGASFAGLTGYLYGPGLHEEHLDAHMVGGNLAVEDRARVIAEELRDVAQENPRVRRPVFHASLALPDGERLTDEQWQRAGERFLDEMGFRVGDREAPWAIVRHDGQEGRHAHIVASRVRFDGSTVSDSYDYKRSHQACRAVEADHGLSSPQPSAERLASVSRSERESAQRRGVAPERGELRQALEEARDKGDGTREDFERRAGERGVLLRANESASTGRMNGYSASLEGWTDTHGEQVWMPASKVHKSLRWQQLATDLAQRRQEQEAAIAQMSGEPEQAQEAEPIGASVDRLGPYREVIGASASAWLTAQAAQLVEDAVRADHEQLTLQRAQIVPAWAQLDSRGASQTRTVQSQRAQAAARAEELQAAAADLQRQAGQQTGWRGRGERARLLQVAQQHTAEAESMRRDVADLTAAEQLLRREGRHLDDWLSRHGTSVAAGLAAERELANRSQLQRTRNANFPDRPQVKRSPPATPDPSSPDRRKSARRGRDPGSQER